MDYRQFPQINGGYAAVVPVDLDAQTVHIPLTHIQATPSAPATVYTTAPAYATSYMPPIAAFEVQSATTPREPRKNWKIDKCEIGNCSTCMYAYFCTNCALADARSTLDGSNWYVNCCIMKPVATRWLIRTAYDIPGNAHDDCWNGAFLPCCVVNQFLQTTQQYGKTTIPEVGPTFNTNNRLGIQQRPFEEVLYDFLYGFLCVPCAHGYALQSVGMPFWFGACCVNSFEANSIIRYHNRYRPIFDNEFYLDLLFPLIGSSISNQTAYLTMGCYATGLLAESNTRAGRKYGYGLDCCEGLCFVHEYCQRGCLCIEPEGRYLVQPSM